MGLIVASPTAGSAGIVPGLLLALQEVYDFSDEDIQKALFNAGAIGYLAMRNATVAGAVGGCQAETGVLCCRLAPWERGTWEKKEWLPWLLLLLQS